MKIFSTLKKQATSFLGQYKQENPATYAAAQQAVGAILITDGFIGIDNPLGGKKRPGIFGTVIGVIFGIIFMLVPTFGGKITNINNMTEETSATVVSVGQNVSSNNNINSDQNSTPSCSLMVKYFVNGKEYSQQSGISSSNYCSLTAGQTININYDPTNPGSWAYNTKTIMLFLWIFFAVGLFMLISSIITFIIRLLSIIFGWKLLKDGRKDAANLPQGTNLETLINEIKQNFAKTIFNFGGVGTGFASGIAATAQGMIGNQPLVSTDQTTQSSIQQGVPSSDPQARTAPTNIVTSSTQATPDLQTEISPQNIPPASEPAQSTTPPDNSNIIK